MSHDPELSERDRLIAALVSIENSLPGGYQLAMSMRIAKSVAEADRLLTQYDLPLREQVVAELTLWRCHAEDGLRLMERGYQLLQRAIRSASEAKEPRPRR